VPADVAERFAALSKEHKRRAILLGVNCAKHFDEPITYHIGEDQ
jgi:hypothetical protein